MLLPSACEQESALPHFLHLPLWDGEQKVGQSYAREEKMKCCEGTVFFRVEQSVFHTNLFLLPSSIQLKHSRSFGCLQRNL